MEKLFLFDFDGVIVNSLEFYETAVKRCLEKIGHPIVRNRADFLDLFDDNFYEALKHKGIDVKVFLAASVEVLAAADDSGITPYTPLVPVLERLSPGNILLIVSSNGSPSIDRILSRDGAKGCFREILGADVMLSKTLKINQAMGQYGVPPERTYYVGDTAGDIREAKQAGVRTVAVTWGWHSRDKLAAAAPDYLINRPEGLLAI